MGRGQDGRWEIRTDIATTRPTRPRGAELVKSEMARGATKYSYVVNIPVQKTGAPPFSPVVQSIGLQCAVLVDYQKLKQTNKQVN